jgi:Na+/melibiose symporter-like transporter
MAAFCSLRWGIMDLVVGLLGVIFCLWVASNIIERAVPERRNEGLA